MNEREGESRRESIWSVSTGWKTAYFVTFSISTLITSCVIAAYEIINRGDADPVKTYLSITERLVPNGVALAIVIYATMELTETIMVVANYIRQNLLEPLKARQRAEGRAEGVAEGRAEGIAEGRAEGIAEGIAESHAMWRAWNERRREAEARGEPFTEPPPDLD